jgi:putative tryptophan/tyrosine transport system substrate-binding protein
MKYEIRRGFLLLVSVLVLFAASCNHADKAANQAGVPAQIKLGIGTIIDHPALQAAIDGFKEGLNNAGYHEGSNLTIDLRNAQGSATNVATIASGLVGSNDTLILSVGTEMTRAITERGPRVPTVFTAVTDPVSAHIVQSLDHPGNPVTGTSDMNPVAEQLALIRELQPSAKRIGILYNPGEANSAVLVHLAKAAAPSMGLTIVEATANNTAGVRTAASSLVGKVDAAYMPTDNTMAAAISAIIDVCREARIPFYSSESESVMNGGSIAALAVDYRGLGRQTAAIAIEILNGRRPESIPVERAKSFELYVNLATAARLGIKIPNAVQTRATKIVKSETSS